MYQIRLKIAEIEWPSYDAILIMSQDYISTCIKFAYISALNYALCGLPFGIDIEHRDGYKSELGGNQELQSIRLQ